MSTPPGTLFDGEATPLGTLFGMKSYTLLLRVPCFRRICSSKYPVWRWSCSFEYPLARLCCSSGYPLRRSLAGMLYLLQFLSLSARLFARLTSVMKSMSGYSVYLASTSLLYFPRRISVAYCMSTLFLCSSSSAFLTSLRLLAPLSD